MYVGEREKARRPMESYTHKPAMHRRKSWNMDFGCRGICNVLCVREQSRLRGMRDGCLGKGRMGIGCESSILSSAVHYSSDVLDRG